VDAYKGHLAACDLRRRNDLDGRGELSEENLAQFTEFFLTTCLDQVAFMEGLMQPERLRTRILFWSEQERRLGSLEDNSGALLEALLYRGEVPRADVPGITGVGDRQARRIVSALAEQGVVISNSPRAPLTLSFPASLASRWMPGLFPERAG
jgi:Fic family protein